MEEKVLRCIRYLPQWEFLSWMNVNFIKYFPGIYLNDHVFLSLFLFICHTDCLYMLNHFFNTGMKLSWSWRMIIFTYYWIKLAHILLRIFASTFIIDIGLKNSFSVVVVVQSLSLVWLFATPWTAACQVSLSFTISWSLLRFMSIESLMLSIHLILCCPLLLLPSVFPSIRVFSNKLAICIGWPKFWSFSFSISPSNEYSWLISFRFD